MLDLNQRLSAYEAGELPGCSNLPESYLHAATTSSKWHDYAFFSVTCFTG